MSVAEGSFEGAPELAPDVPLLDGIDLSAGPIDPEARLVLQLRFLDGMTEEGIADRVDRPPSEVRAMIKRNVAALMTRVEVDA